MNTEFTAQVATATIAFGRTPSAAIKAARKAGQTGTVVVIHTATGTQVLIAAGNVSGRNDAWK